MPAVKVSSVAMTPDGAMAVSDGSEEAVCTWSFPACTLLHSAKGWGAADVAIAAMALTGSHTVVSMGQGGFLSTWSLDGLEALGTAVNIAEHSPVTASQRV